MKWFEWFMTILACIGLSIVACSCVHGRQPPCVSYCGMLIESVGNGSVSCDTIDEAEKTWMDQTDKEFCSKDKRFCKKEMCSKVFGWQVQADKDVIVYVDYKGTGRLPVVGLSNCLNREMWLGANSSWRNGSYPHEMFHVVTECSSGWKDGGESSVHGQGHEGWTSHGVYSFIEDFREGRR